MKIRTATIADLPVITEIYRQTRTEAQHAAADCQAWFDTHAQSDRYGVWVAVVHGAVVGYGAIDPYETAYATSAAEIRYGLANDAEGNDWGSELLAFLVDWGQKMSFTYLVGRALSNEQCWNQLFLKAGFIKWGQSPDLIDLPQATTSLSYYAKYLK